MKKRIYLFLMASILVLGHVHGQYTETIASSRPGASFTPYTTGKQIFQLQTGFLFYKDTSTPSVRLNGFGYGLQLRYGITENLEVRAATLLRSDKVDFSGSESSFGGLSLLDAGVRWHALNESTTDAMLSFQGEVRFGSVGAPEYQSGNSLSPRILALFSVPVTSWMGFTTNLGLSWYDGIDASGTYTANLSFPLSDSMSTFVEIFGSFDSGSSVNFDTGLAYLLNNDFQLDLALGFAGDIKNNFVDIGLSWRTSR